MLKPNWLNIVIIFVTKEVQQKEKEEQKRAPRQKVAKAKQKNVSFKMRVFNNLIFACKKTTEKRKNRTVD